jgi:sulfatase modifying factor 1
MKSIPSELVGVFGKSALFAAVIVAIGLIFEPSVRADAFGSGTNVFTIDFVSVGNEGNAADTTGYGAVPYEYRMGVYEISQNNIDQATASGLANVTSAGPWTGNQPTGRISWFEAAAFVNWMNTSTGRQAAYNVSYSLGLWYMTLWSSGDAWTAGGTNLYRHKDAYYFLPSENEWYKAAYFNPSGSNYFLYPTGSDTQPTPVLGGTNSNTAVFNLGGPGPAAVTNAGGLSPYGTMAQGGNMTEWIETAFDGNNESAYENRTIRGGGWGSFEGALNSATRGSDGPQSDNYAFRVASVPEPSTYALLLMAGAGALWWARRRR